MNDYTDLPVVDASEVTTAPVDTYVVVNADGTSTEVTSEVLGTVQEGEGPVATEFVTQ